MDHCPDHKDHTKKLVDLCTQAARTDTTMNRIGREVESIYLTIFGEGDSNSLKSRILRTEDEVKGLKELVLENRAAVKDNIKELEQALDRKLLVINAVEFRVAAMEKDAWLPRMLNTSIHKAVIAIIGLVIVMAVTNMGVWAVSKNFIFRETPNQQQQIEALIQKYLLERTEREPSPSPALPFKHRNLEGVTP